MKSHRTCWRDIIHTLIVITSLLAGCKAPPARLSESTPPKIRVGIVEGRAAVEFKVEGKLNLMNRRGKFALRGVPGGHWRVEAIDGKPAQFEYRLAVGTTKDRRESEGIVAFMKKKGVKVEIKKYKIEGKSRLRFLHKAAYQVVLTQKFGSERAARAFQATLQDKTNSDLVRIPRGNAQGTLRFSNLDTKYTFDSQEPVRLEATEVELADVDVGQGFHWQRSEHRKYTGSVEFVLDHTGQITVINELSLESYIRGVVPSEMPAGFPFEALKAQAVTARVEALSKIGVRHPVEPFDLCDDVHCQVFSGSTKQNEKTDRAVASTRGTVMLHKGQVSEAFYAGVCGGHTEHNDNVWLMNARPYLRGVLDKDSKRLRTNLQQESNIKKWIDSKPRVYCNTTGGDVPASLSYSKKYFRWQVTYARTEFENIIREKTGMQFGRLVDLRPVKRGVSGRLIELEVVGTDKKFTISKELAIRQALARKTLFSACFYVKKSGGSGNLPARFVLAGAGWGHGVGMCQVGAAMMANKGKKFDQILTHYYKGVRLERVYK
ncbi:MAG: SpoIID/LytB domain-containing protein [bacterium]